jgi:hypothetical protein
VRQDLGRREDPVGVPDQLGEQPILGCREEVGNVKRYVRLVRRKIEENARMPRSLISRRDLGYTLVSRPDTAS